MASIVHLNKRGSLTLPAEVRRHFNLQADDILLVEKTSKGVLLRPAQAVPIVQFDEQQLAGMEAMAEELENPYENR